MNKFLATLAGHGITSTTNQNYAAHSCWEFSSIRSFWVGGIEGGVQWFAENNRNWHNASEHNGAGRTRWFDKSHLGQSDGFAQDQFH